MEIMLITAKDFLLGYNRPKYREREREIDITDQTNTASQV